MAVTPFDPPYPKTLCRTRTLRLCVIEPELWPIDVIHCGNRDFRSFNDFCSCDLDLDPMTFLYKLDLYDLQIYRMHENDLPTLRL